MTTAERINALGGDHDKVRDLLRDWYDRLPAHLQPEPWRDLREAEAEREAIRSEPRAERRLFRRESA